MSYATCRRCGAQLAEPKLGGKIECPSCHATYSVKTPIQATDGAPHCVCCGAELNDDELKDKTRIWKLEGGPIARPGLAALGHWVCSACSVYY